MPHWSDTLKPIRPAISYNLKRFSLIQTFPSGLCFRVLHRRKSVKRGVGSGRTSLEHSVQRPGKKKQKTKFHSKYTWRSVFLNSSVRPHITAQRINGLNVWREPANTPETSQKQTVELCRAKRWRSSQIARLKPPRVKAKLLQRQQQPCWRLLLNYHSATGHSNSVSAAVFLRAKCRSAPPTTPPPPLRAKNSGCLSACNPVQLHRSRETRVEPRPTSASSRGQILDLLRNPRRSCWTALYLFIVNNGKTRRRSG